MLSLIDSGPYQCGETPLWNQKTESLYWVDAASHLIYSLKKGIVKSYNTGVKATALRLDEKGDFLILSKWGLHYWNPESHDTTVKPGEGCQFLNDRGPLRFNDGVPLSGGDFIAGAFDEKDLYNGRGSLYLLNRKGKSIKLDEELHVPNGVAWSQRENYIYLSEMYKQRIIRYKLNNSRSEIITKDIFTTIPEEEGKPDGLLLDRSGNLWVAHWRGWRLSCYSPDGILLNSIETPFASPTCFCFSDDNEKCLYLTSATLELDPDELKRSEHPGGIFKVEI